jgi:uncharacterized membrane protein
VSRSDHGSVVAAGLLLGAGLGGFLDGIVLHQILQWHNMLSELRPPTNLAAMKYNMVWDGVFHAMTWLMVALGVWRLWVASRRDEAPRSTRVLVGALLLGWGLFNVVEGSINHHLLELHHVRPGAQQLAWDLGFLALGLAQIVYGSSLIRRGIVRANASLKPALAAR